MSNLAVPMTANSLLKDINLKDIKALPAGGLDRDRFDWQEVWYPVFYVEDLDKAKPAKFTLLERDLVIWWDRHTNAWRAFDDRCPHRLVPLSEGRDSAPPGRGAAPANQHFLKEQILAGSGVLSARQGDLLQIA